MPNSKTEPLPAVPPASHCSLDLFALIAECPGSGTGMDSFWWVFEVKGKRNELDEKCAALREAAKAGAIKEMFATSQVVEATIAFSANAIVSQSAADGTENQN